MKEKESEQLFSKQLFPCPCIKLDKGLLDYKTTYKRDIERQLSKHVLTEVYMWSFKKLSNKFSLFLKSVWLQRLEKLKKKHR